MCRSHRGRDWPVMPLGNEDDGLKLSSIVASSLRRRFRPLPSQSAASHIEGSQGYRCRGDGSGSSTQMQRRVLDVLSAQVNHLHTCYGGGHGGCARLVVVLPDSALACINPRLGCCIVCLDGHSLRLAPGCSTIASPYYYVCSILCISVGPDLTCISRAVHGRCSSQISGWTNTSSSPHASKNPCAAGRDLTRVDDCSLHQSSTPHVPVRPRTLAVRTEQKPC